MDHQSRFNAVCFIIDRDQDLDTLRIFALDVAVVNSFCIDNDGSHNGGEYTAEGFFQHFKDMGIKQESTAPFNAAQVGVLAHMGRALLNITRCLLHEWDFRSCCGTIVRHREIPHE